MANILLLETSTKNCSVGLSISGEVLGVKEEASSQFVHSEKLHLFIRDIIEESNITFNDLDAVAVGKGPGSYTGLRIGVSSAKGLCYGLGIPLISVDSLQILAKPLFNKVTGMIIPMMDARRMEVYLSRFSESGKTLSHISAEIIDENSFNNEFLSGPVHFIGDGVEKIKKVVVHENAHYHDILYPSVINLNTLAQEKFKAKSFEDVAYFEPFYLKDFVAGKPKKLL